MFYALKVMVLGAKPFEYIELAQNETIFMSQTMCLA